MSTLTLQSLAARDLHGYDAPSASGTSQAAVTHLAVAAVIVVTVIVVVLAVLIRAATGATGLFGEAMGVVFRLVASLVAVIVVLGVLLASRTGAALQVLQSAWRIQVIPPDEEAFDLHLSP